MVAARFCRLRFLILAVNKYRIAGVWVAVKVKSDMAIKIDESVLGVKEWECEVISNKNVATFIKEFIVALPKGEHMDFIPGSYAHQDT